jgi:hypothetical protein
MPFSYDQPEGLDLEEDDDGEMKPTNCARGGAWFQLEDLSLRL